MGGRGTARAEQTGRAAEQAARRAARKGEPWTDRAARAGYVARGLVYILVGGLALAAAAGVGGRATNPTGALSMLVRVPAGQALLALVAAGLLLHAGFRAALVLTGEPYVKQGRWRGALARVRHAFAACVYAAMALTAAGWTVRGGRRGQAHGADDEQTRDLSARVLAAPFGRPLLIAVGVGLGVAAVVALVRAFGPNNVRERLRLEAMSARQCRLMAALGRLAYVARATVFGACGYFVVRAAIHQSPRETRGPGGALRAVWELPHGGLLLALVAAGLIAFGVYGVLEARWRRLFGH